MRIIDWSSDVCSSDLFPAPDLAEPRQCRGFVFQAERAAKRSARDPGIFNPEQQVTGLVAEWSCSGLQSRVRRFNSDPGLQFPVRATGPSGTCRENRQARGRPDFAEDSVAMNCDLRMRPRRAFAMRADERGVGRAHV